MFRRILSMFSWLLPRAIGFALACGAFYLSGKGLIIGWKHLISLPKEVLAPMFALIGIIITTIAGKLFDKNNEIQTRMREKKAAGYRQIIDFLVNMKQYSESEDTLAVKYTEIMPDLVLWGGSDVLNEWTEYRYFLMFENISDMKPIELLNKTDKLLLTIRKDMGHNNSRLKAKSLLRLFVNDIP